MEKHYFLEEAHRYIDSLYREFIGYQEIVWNLFIFFDGFCRKNSIQYYMGFGSLLGTVRDHGMIPWDYDMDVVVRIDDAKRLIALLERDMPSTIYYAFINNVSEYPTNCLRICQKGYPFTSIHLDVFFLIGNPDKHPDRFVNKIQHYHDLRTIKYGAKWFPSKKEDSRLSYLLDAIRKIRKKTISSKSITKFENEMFYKYSLAVSKYCSIVGDPYLKVYYTDDFREPLEIEANGIRVFIPNGYERILKTIYKDYSSYPPISRRFEEFYYMVMETKKRDEYMCNDTSGIFDFCK